MCNVNLFLHRIDGDTLVYVLVSLQIVCSSVHINRYYLFERKQVFGFIDQIKTSKTLTFRTLPTCLTEGSVLQQVETAHAKLHTLCFIIQS